MPVRTNPFLRIVPARDRDGFRVADLAGNAEYHLPNAGMLGLLGAAREWTDRESLAAVGVDEFGLPSARADDVLDSMVETGFLVEPDSGVAALDREGDRWRADGWGAAFEFLVTIRDYPYYREHDYESAMARVASRAEQGDVPPVYERYEGQPRVSLPPVESAGPFPSVRAIFGRNGLEVDEDSGNTGDGMDVNEGFWNGGDGVDGDDGGTTIDAATLSALLYYTFGETGRQLLPNVGEFLLKTSPSGGGRHPIEAYLAALDVEGVPPGLYHYAVDGHELERLGGHEDAVSLLDFLGNGDGAEPALGVVCSAVLARNMWKYRDPRAYRIPFHDLGHLVETLGLCCGARGLPVEFGVDLDSDAMSDLLGPAGLEAPPLAYALVGRRIEE